MESKKINQLATEMAPASTDLTIIGDPITGVSKKVTLEQISSLFASSISFYTNYASFPATGSIDTLYCAKDTNKLYLWSGSAYVETFPSQALLDTYQLRSEKGNANGYASLDGSGKVPSTQLPSYVDDIIEVANYASLPVTGETGKIYITLDNNKIYRWSGSVYVEIAANNAIWGSITGTLSNQTDLQNALNAKVPYTGATANVNLGEYELKTGQLTLDTTPTGTATVGTTRWNDTIGSSETTLKGGNVILKNGVDLVARVVNKVSPNTTLTKAAYPAVRVSGAQGQRLAIAYAQANNDNNSADTIGLVTETIATNQEGFIMTVGQLEGIDTTGSLQGETWADGDVLYLSPTTAGALTNIKPTGATGHIVVMGYVEYAHANNGKIYVKIMNGWELDELHNVYISSVANNEGLFYESSTSLWKNKSIATVLGYTPADDSAVVKLTGTQTIGGTKTFSSQPKFDLGIAIKEGTSGGLTGYTCIGANVNQLLIGIVGATHTLTFPTSSSYTYTFPSGTGTLALSSELSSYVPTSRTVSTTSPLSGGGALSSDLTLSISQASGSANGYLSSTDWTTFNNKQGALTLTTTGSSGASTLVGNTLNVPTYTLSGLGGVPTSRTLTINGTTYDLSTDRSWTISAGISGSGTTNYVPKFTSGSAIGNSLIFDDGTNVGIGTTSPGALLDVNGNIYSRGNVLGDTFGGYSGGNVTLTTNTGGSANLLFATATTERMRISSGGAVGINTSSPSSTSALTLQESSSLSSALRMTNRNSSQSWSLAVDVTAVDDKYLAFIDNTGSVARMVIGQTGNVGIGNTNPQTTLSVETSGTQNVVSPIITGQGSGTTYTGLYSIRDGAGDQRGLIFQVYTANVGLNEKMRISSAGSVGINTSTFPSSNYKFVVKQGTNRNLAIAEQSSTLSIEAYNDAANANVPLAFYASSYAFNNGAATFASNVTASSYLKVFNTSYPSTYATSLRSDSGAVGVLQLGNNNDNYILAGNTATGGYLAIRVNCASESTSAGIEAMRISSAGNVGIGTSSPASLLEIAATGPTLRINSTTGGNDGILAWYVNTNYIGDIRTNSGSGAMTFNQGPSAGWGGYMVFKTDTSERMRITSAGNIAIGGTSGTGRVQIWGVDQSSSNYTQINYDSQGNVILFLRNDGLISTGTRAVSPYNLTTGTAANMVVDSSGYLYRSTSSLKYKTDVRNYDKGLAEVLQMRPVYYKGKNDGEKQFAGLIAEEVQDLGLTEFVQYAPDGTPDALAYSNMVTLLVKAIQELKSEIDKLKNK